MSAKILFTQKDTTYFNLCRNMTVWTTFLSVVHSLLSHPKKKSNLNGEEVSCPAMVTPSRFSFMVSTCVSLLLCRTFPIYSRLPCSRNGGSNVQDTRLLWGFCPLPQVHWCPKNSPLTSCITLRPSPSSNMNCPSLGKNPLLIWILFTWILEEKCNLKPMPCL